MSMHQPYRSIVARHLPGVVAVVRDVFVVFALSLAPLLPIMIVYFFLAPEKDPPPLSDFLETVTLLLSLTAGAAGFAISACMTSVNRWKHISVVALIFWVWIGSADLSESSLASWFEVGLHTAVMMIVGGLASYFFQPHNPMKPVSEPQI